MEEAVPTRSRSRSRSRSTSSSSGGSEASRRSAAGGGERTPVAKKKSVPQVPGGTTTFFGNLTGIMTGGIANLKVKKTSANRKGSSNENSGGRTKYHKLPKSPGGKKRSKNKGEASREVREGQTVVPRGPDGQTVVPRGPDGMTVTPRAPDVPKEPVFEKPGGKDMASLPPGMKASDFQRPEGAGTDFVLDLGPPKPAAAPAAPTAPAANEPKVKAMELDGGQNCATLPPGAKPEDFARPEGAGTDFVLDLGPPKPAGGTTTTTTTSTGNTTMSKVDEEGGEGAAGKVNAMELEGGKTMATLPPGAKPEDFARPADAGTGFVLDLGPPPAKPCSVAIALFQH